MLRLELEYEFDFSVFGISCYEQPYRLCWLLNKNLMFNFAKDEDICVYQTKTESFHTTFNYSSEEDQYSLHLIRNRSDDGFLVPELPQIDFFLKARDYLGDEDHLLGLIRDLKWVNAAFRIEVENLKSKENLIFD